jgi:hypothetical protein
MSKEEYRSNCARTEGYNRSHLNKNRTVFVNEEQDKSIYGYSGRELPLKRRNLVNIEKFSQLKSRFKKLKLNKSKIHECGVFAVETIAANEMVIF